MSAIRKKNVTQLNTEYVSQQQNMQENSNRKRIGLIRRLTVFGILVALVSIMMVSTLISQASAISDKKKEKAQLTEQLSQLKQKEKDLEEEVVKLNDEEYIKKIARRDYFLSEEGEIIFNVQEGSSSN
ncbi:FtsB family cell division protein [Priestia abyssalis]|uniref:FtsB family cell division protein n=1 Tax=Priestia abyssalis TaxID=1221450 RepID=UPI0009954AA5|nr:septum formation initiator family protein [Priestia abyssalis]